MKEISKEAERAMLKRSLHKYIKSTVTGEVPIGKTAKKRIKEEMLRRDVVNK